MAGGLTAMPGDRYGLPLSTASAEAAEAYNDGSWRILAAYPGALAALDRAIDADPDFALAHVAKARSFQLVGKMPQARAAFAIAQSLADALPEREASHLAVFTPLIAGQADAALAQVRAHLDRWPTDAMVLSTTANQGGLIGLSGRAGREEELTAFLEPLAPAYDGDPWFNAHYGMALSETSRQAEARPLIEKSITDEPRNAFGAHAYAHLCYETDEHAAARAFLRQYLPDYAPDGALYGHLNWHLALGELAAGNVAEGFRLFTSGFGAEDYRAAPLLKLVDSAAFLWRAELAGHAPDPDLWRHVHEFAHAAAPGPGAMAMADWHVALADLAIGDTDSFEARTSVIEALVPKGRYPAGPALAAIVRGFAAFRRGDNDAAIAAIAPAIAERERIGGSRAQVDLVEFTLLKAYLAAGRDAEARALVDARRPGPVTIPVSSA